MDKREASLILRMQMALAREGVGPKDPKPDDADLLADATRTARDEFDDHHLWDMGLLSDDEHFPSCNRWPCRKETSESG